MDISYLLFLQNFRNSIDNAWTPCMESVSLFAITYLIFIPVFVYWCFHKRAGLFVLVTLNLTLALNVLAKLTACVYRPWIRDPRILPAGDAIKTAGGYSFPSGHTSTATAVYGGLAWQMRQNKKLQVLVWLCILGILVTGFSRNYLGVHTPQDVLVAILVGGLALWLTQKIFTYLDKHPEQENKLLLGGIVFIILSLVYITYKPYPVDYVEGKMLMDPAKMIQDGYGNLGWLLGFCVARYVERRWIHFHPAGLTVKNVILCLIGLVLLALMMKYLRSWLIACLGPCGGRLALPGLCMFYVVAIYPLVLKYFCKPLK